MTVCFSYDPQRSSDVTPFDRFNTRGQPGADGKISTYDIYAVWPNRKSADKSEDRELCYAFEAALAKKWFYDYAIVPVTQASQRWSYWLELPQLVTTIAKAKIEVVEGINAVGQWAFMDEAGDRSPVFTSAKEFVGCTSRELTATMLSGRPVGAMAIVNQCGTLEL